MRPKPADFIDVARQLVDGAGPRRPRQAYLRRAVSTSYYALFHTICGNVADLLVDKRSQGDPAWVWAYRTLDHGSARTGCNYAGSSKQFPPSIQEFANEFVQAQEKRHKADYDPSAHFRRSDVLQDIDDAEKVIGGLKVARTSARKAFIARLVLYKKRP